MKNSIVILFLLLLSQLGYGQGRAFKVTARPWVKGQKDLPWKEYDTRTIAQLDGFKATDKVHVNEYGSVRGEKRNVSICGRPEND